MGQSSCASAQGRPTSGKQLVKVSADDSLPSQPIPRGKSLSVTVFYMLSSSGLISRTELRICQPPIYVSTFMLRKGSCCNIYLRLLPYSVGKILMEKVQRQAC